MVEIFEAYERLKLAVVIRNAATTFLRGVLLRPRMRDRSAGSVFHLADFSFT